MAQKSRYIIAIELEQYCSIRNESSRLAIQIHSVFLPARDVLGLVLESGSLDALMERVRLAVPELLRLNGGTEQSIPLVFRSERRECMAGKRGTLGGAVFPTFLLFPRCTL